jgi:hypothetical protein
MLLKTWNRGKFNFWIVGISYMRRRDAMIQRFFELQGKAKERKRIIELIENECFCDVDYRCPLEDVVDKLKKGNK